MAIHGFMVFIQKRLTFGTVDLNCLDKACNLSVIYSHGKENPMATLLSARYKTKDTLSGYIKINLKH